MSDVTITSDPALLEAEIAEHLGAARIALTAAGRLVRQLEQTARAAAAQAEAASRPRLVRFKAAPLIGPDGQPIKRRRRRPIGAKNGTRTDLTILATSDQLEKLPRPARRSVNAAATDPSAGFGPQSPRRRRELFGRNYQASTKPIRYF